MAEPIDPSAAATPSAAPAYRLLLAAYLVGVSDGDDPMHAQSVGDDELESVLAEVDAYLASGEDRKQFSWLRRAAERLTLRIEAGERDRVFETATGPAHGRDRQR